MTPAQAREAALLARAMKAGGLWPMYPGFADPAERTATAIVQTPEWARLRAAIVAEAKR